MVTTETLEKTKLANDAPVWLYARCPYCSLRYPYVSNSYYRPKTCSNYDCQRRYLHTRTTIHDSDASKNFKE